MIGVNYEVRYHVRAPKNAVINLSNTNGMINVSGLSGKVHARTTNGGVRGKDLTGEVDARTTNGGVNISSRKLAEPITLRTTMNNCRCTAGRRQGRSDRDLDQRRRQYSDDQSDVRKIAPPARNERRRRHVIDHTNGGIRIPIQRRAVDHRQRRQDDSGANVKVLKERKSSARR